MVGFEEVTVRLQSGVEATINAWAGRDDAQPMLIVGSGTAPSDWNEFASFLGPSHSPVLTSISTPLDLLHLIWEVGEPVLLMSQGEEATQLIAHVVATAAGAVSGIVLCDGELDSDEIGSMHEISTLILRGRQSSAVSHESAVRMHESLRHSTLAEPEDCGDFPARSNPNAAASAVNWFLTGSSVKEFDESEPVDPKA